MRSNHVKNGSLLAVDLRDEAGADFALGPVDFQPISTNDTVYASVTITAPKAGMVIANATAWISHTGGDARVRCSISTGSAVDGPYRFLAWVTSSAPNATMSGSRGFDVNAGSTTFNLVCERIDGPGGFIGAPHMTAMYFPTRY